MSERFIGPLPEEVIKDTAAEFNLFPQDRIVHLAARDRYGQEMAEEKVLILKEKLANSEIDQLTGVYRKDAIYDKLNEMLLGFEMGRRLSDRYNGVMVMVLDAEEFKKINDIDGYAAGNKSLAAIGKLLINTARVSKGDMPARVGGDEFVLVIPYDKEETDEDVLLKSLEARIRDCVPERYPGLPSLRWNHAFYRPGDTAENLIEVKADVKGKNIHLYRSHSQSDVEYQRRLALFSSPVNIA
jgi:diguanylate cyclase (GGDEF)-like protein